jgi:hypothetical protein
MTKIFKLIILFFSIVSVNSVYAANWCKVVYNKQMSEGQLQTHLSKCKNSDNFFLAVHTSYQNAGHLLNSLIAENCDLRREIVSTRPRQGDPYFTAVCEFRRHNIR